MTLSPYQSLVGFASGSCDVGGNRGAGAGSSLHDTAPATTAPMSAYVTMDSLMIGLHSPHRKRRTAPLNRGDRRMDSVVVADPARFKAPHMCAEPPPHMCANIDLGP